MLAKRWERHWRACDDHHIVVSVLIRTKGIAGRES
jgi:hypothetical protein